MVIVSVAAEFVIVISHPAYDSRLEIWGSAIADAFIALGIIGEVGFGIWDGRIQTALRRLSNKQLGDAIRIAGEANARAEEARERIAQLEFESGNTAERIAMAEERAAEANREAKKLLARAIEAEAQIARLKAMTGPRIIRGDIFMEKMKGKSSALFVRIVYPKGVGGDSGHLAGQLQTLLRHCDWNAGVPEALDTSHEVFRGWTVVFGGVDSGIRLWLSAEDANNQPHILAMSALRDAIDASLGNTAAGNRGDILGGSILLIVVVPRP